MMKMFLKRIISVIFRKLESASQGYVYYQYGKKYNIHPSFCFNGEGIRMYGEGEIIIAENSYIGRYSNLQTSKDCKIIIGKNCSIGPFFSIWTQTSYVDFDFNNRDCIFQKLGDIVINDAVWIGANVVISPGVTIGENSIIGANSVVTKDVPPFAIVGGIPAQLIRYKNIG